MVVKILNDPEGVYENGTTITIQELVSDYLDTLNENDKTLFDENWSDRDLADFIADAWRLTTEIIND